MGKKIIVYTSNNCVYCLMVKKYLSMKKLGYQEINIDEKPQLRQQMIEMTGQNRVPVTVVTDDKGAQNITIGYNVTKLASAVN